MYSNTPQVLARWIHERAPLPLERASSTWRAAPASRRRPSIACSTSGPACALRPCSGCSRPRPSSDYMPAEDLLAAMAPKPMRLLFLLPAGTNRFLVDARTTDRAFRRPARALQRPCQVDSIEELQSRTAGASSSGSVGRQGRRHRLHGARASGGAGSRQHAGRARRADGDADLGHRSMRAAPPMSDWTIARPDAPPAI